jgi:hypothetical protein
VTYSNFACGIAAVSDIGRAQSEKLSDAETLDSFRTALAIRR